MARAVNCEAKDLANLGRSFCALELLKMRIKMKPAPKPVDTTKLQARSGSRSHAHQQPSFAEQ